MELYLLSPIRLHAVVLSQAEGRYVTLRYVTFFTQIEANHMDAQTYQVTYTNNRLQKLL